VVARGTHVIELRQHLLGQLGARFAPEGDDDVAKLTLEGTTARKLQRTRCVLIRGQQVVAGLGHPRHIRPFRLLIDQLMRFPCSKIGQKLWPGEIGLTQKQHIAQSLEEIGLH